MTETATRDGKRINAAPQRSIDNTKGGVMSGAPVTPSTAPIVGSVAVPLDFHDEKSFRAARRGWESLVMCDKAMNASERLVVLRVATFAGPDAPAWPSAETVAANLGLSARQVKRGLARGRERGWLLRIGRRAFGGSMRYVLSADQTVAREMANRLEGERIIRQIRRDHPDVPRRSIRATRGTNGAVEDGALKGHPRPSNGATGVPSLGPPVSPDPIQGTYPLNPSQEASEEVVVLGRNKSPEPRAAHTSARATGGHNGTEAIPLSGAVEAALARLAPAIKVGARGENK